VIKRCEAEGCQATAAVGWGQPAKWYCLKHFDEKMNEVKKLLDRVKGIGR
jgi:hypothetical protein